MNRKSLGREHHHDNQKLTLLYIHPVVFITWRLQYQHHNLSPCSERRGCSKQAKQKGGGETSDFRSNWQWWSTELQTDRLIPVTKWTKERLYFRFLAFMQILRFNLFQANNIIQSVHGMHFIFSLLDFFKNVKQAYQITMTAVCVCVCVSSSLNLWSDWSAFTKSGRSIMPLEAISILKFDCKYNPHFTNITRLRLQDRKSA